MVGMRGCLFSAFTRSWSRFAPTTVALVPLVFPGLTVEGAVGVDHLVVGGNTSVTAAATGS